MEPDTAATNMVAHTMSTFKRPISADILKPIPTIGSAKEFCYNCPNKCKSRVNF